MYLQYQTFNEIFGTVKCLSIFVKFFTNICMLHTYIKMKETLELKVQFDL